jgi:RHS repeat-associated protein
MNKLITYGLALILSSILVSSPVLTLSASHENPKLALTPRGVKIAPPKAKNPVSRAKAQAATPVAGQTSTSLPDSSLLIIGGQGTDGARATAGIKDPRTGEVTPLSASLHHARAWHSATMLPDGRVLVVGGLGAGGQVLASAEIFDPETQTFELLSPAGLTPRAYHTATLLTDGLVLLAGGISDKGRASSRADFWDLQTKTATELTGRLAMAREKHKATLLPDGNVLLEDGVDGNGNEVKNAELYNTQARDFNFATLTSRQEDDAAPFLAASLPVDGASDVPVDSRVALRFSKLLRVETVNTETISLTGPRGIVASKIVPAENGRLAFISPIEKLLPDTTYTLSVGDSRDAANHQLPSTVLTFTTAGEPAPGHYDDEDWIPDAQNLRGNWRSKHVSSEAQSLPPLRADSGVTALAGQALALSGRPLARVTLQIGDKSAETDDTGRFLLSNIPSGHQVMKLNGRTANVPGKTYGIFKVGVDVTEGETNVLPYTIWMPKLDIAHAVTIQSPTTRDIAITNPLIPGLELQLPQQTAVRDMDGQTVTQISITPIPTNQPPFPLPPGVIVPVFFTIQPGGAQVIPPRTRLIYPNFTNQPAGARIDFWNYDAEDKGWYIYGQGTVSGNGRQIVPDPGVVLYEFSGAMISNPSNAPPEGPNPCNPCGDGDPVDLSNGLFVYSKTDLMIPDVTPIELTRTYRPRDSVSRPFGIGTTHPYEIFLVGDFDFYSYVDLILPDGGRVHYNRLYPGTDFNTTFEHTGTPSAFYKSQVSWNGGGWNLTLKNGTVYRFPDSDGLTSPRFAALTGISDRFGNQLTLTRDVNLNLTRIASANGRSIDFTYDANYRITQAQDNIGRTVGYTYDGSGRLSTVTDVAGGITQYLYDTSNRMTKITDAKGLLYLTNTYDANGRVTKQTQADSTTFLFAYTIANGRVSQTDVTDPRGNIRRVTFNTSGYMVTDTHAQGKPEQRTVTYERQAGTNQVLSVTDPLNRKTAYVYDSMGNVTSVTRLSGTSPAITTTFTYEPVHNKVASVTDPLNHTVSFTYDANGSIASVTDPLNHQTTFAHNSAGQIASITDALQHSTQFGYEAGYLTTVTNPKGATALRFLDDAGRALAVTDVLGRSVRYSYNAMNQITKATDPLAGVTSFVYDANGNLLTVTDARNNIKTYTYNNMDRLTARKDALLRTQSYEYDGMGNLTKFTDRRGKVTTFTYDRFNRPTFVGFGTVTQGQSTTYESTITYTYDAGDRLTKSVDSLSGTIDLVYDSLNRLISETTPQGTVSYTYDAASRRTSMTIAGQPTINYAYDNANRQTGSTQGTSSVSFTFDEADRLTTSTLPNGVRTEYSYDQASQVTGIAYKTGAMVLGNLNYGLDDAGRRIKIGGSYGRTSLPQPLATTSHNANNQLTQRGASVLTYDANGNLVGDGVNTYTWDARNQLASINGAGLSGSFSYDAFGRRRGKTINSVTTEFVYDGVNAVQEKTGGAPSANLLTGGVDETFTRTDATGAHHLLTDGLGSTLGLTDSNGSETTQYTYEPFGKTSVSGLTSSNPSQYTGRENDGSGLYYYRARYYSPTLQRFISEDPAGGTNLYAYAGNDPVNMSDPQGRWPTRIKHVHQNSAGRVLGDRLAPIELKWLQDSLYHADDSEHQTVERSPQHAMTAGRGSKAEARKAANDFVRENLDAARNSVMSEDAMRYLGRAMHAMQDSTSPQHHDFQRYYGGYLELAAHIVGEFFDPLGGSNLDRATERAFKYYTGELPYPDDFFAGLCADSDPMLLGGQGP